MLAAALTSVAFACSDNSVPATSCGELLACCGAMATPDLRAACMSNLPSSEDDSACKAQLSKLDAQGMCGDAGADGGSGETCQTATFSCGPGGSLQYCHSATSTGACTDPHYNVAGQTFPCATCTDLSACGDAARAACQGGGDSGPD